MLSPTHLYLAKHQLLLDSTIDTTPWSCTPFSSCSYWVLVRLVENFTYYQSVSEYLAHLRYAITVYLLSTKVTRFYGNSFRFGNANTDVNTNNNNRNDSAFENEKGRVDQNFGCQNLVINPIQIFALESRKMLTQHSHTAQTPGIDKARTQQRCIIDAAAWTQHGCSMDAAWTQHRRSIDIV